MGFGKEAWCGVVTAPGTASRQFAKSWRGDGGPLSQRLAWKQEMSRSVITLAIVRDRARASARLSPSALCCTILHCTTLYYTKALARGSTTSGTKGRWGRGGGEGRMDGWSRQRKLEGRRRAVPLECQGREGRVAREVNRARIRYSHGRA